MKTKRSNVFETNSSGTHSLSMNNGCENYLPNKKEFVIKFLDTDEEDTCLESLQDKVSYLVCQLIDKQKYYFDDYSELKEEIEDNYNYKNLKHFVERKFGITFRLPKSYNGDIEKVVKINYEISNPFEDVIDELFEDVIDEDYKLETILSNKTRIEIGRD